MRRNIHNINGYFLIVFCICRYNFVAKKLFKRLSQLSGTPLVPLILCDDQHDLGLDAGLDSNLPALWDTILDNYPLPADRTVIPRTEM